MADDIPVRQRTILNANKNISNIINYEVIKGDLQNVADKLFNILKDHYGPFSGFAALDTGDVMKETQFTKDGIGIVRHIEFAAPQEDWVRKTIAYIGKKIETAVGDGTTSSMMFACAMLKHMIATVDQIRPIAFVQLRQAYDSLIKDIDKVIKENAWKVSKDGSWVEDVYKLVYQQAYTSSHGDKELSTALANLFSDTPPELWNHMTYERRLYECEDRFTVTRGEGQYQMNCDVMANAMLNKDLATRYEHDDCHLYIMNDAIRKDSESWIKIISAMEEATEEHPFVLISRKRMDMNSYQEFMPILDKTMDRARCVAIFQTDPEYDQINDFVSLQLLAGVEITKAIKQKDTVLDVDHVKIRFKNKMLFIDNLYEVPEEYKSLKERHHCVDGKHIQFTDYLEGVKRFVTSYNKIDADIDSREKYNYFARMYAKLRYPCSPIMQIGGHALDNIALVDVVDDCIRAASKALENGVVYGNNRSLFHALQSFSLDRKDPKNLVRAWLLTAMIHSLIDIVLAARDRMYPGKFRKTIKKLKDNDFVTQWFGTNADVLKFDPTKTPLDQFKKLPLKVYESMNLEEFSCKAIVENPLIVQPANADISMLERFGEVALKYVLTERVIVKGAAYVEDIKGVKK